MYFTDNQSEYVMADTGLIFSASCSGVTELYVDSYDVPHTMKPLYHWINRKNLEVGAFQ